MDDLLPLLSSQEAHHAFGRRAARHSVDLGPSLWRVEKGSDGVKARDAIGASDNGSKILDGGVELWQVVVDAGLADGVFLG